MAFARNTATALAIRSISDDTMARTGGSSRLPLASSFISPAIASSGSPTIRFAVRRSTMISPPMIAIAAISSVSSAWRASAITALIGRSTRTNHAPLMPLKWIGVSMRSTSPSAGSDVRPMLPMLAGAGLPSSAALRL